MSQNNCREHEKAKEQFLQSQSPGKKYTLLRAIDECLHHDRSRVDIPLAPDADTRLINFVKQLKHNKDSGDEQAMFLVSQSELHFKGNKHFIPDIEPEQNAKMVWLHAAASQGYAWAMKLLGQEYLEENAQWEDLDGTKRIDKEYAYMDDVVAIQWFRKAAEHGDREAMYELGFCCRGRGGISNKESHKWLLKAANLEHPESMVELAQEFLRGYGEVAEDEKLGKMWVRKAFESADNEESKKKICSSLIMCEYSTLNRNTGLGDMLLDVPTSVAKIRVDYYQQLDKNIKEENNTHRQMFLREFGWRLGVCYLHGIGTMEDRAKGVEWLQRSIDNGNANTAWRLGECYLHGYGVPKDNKKAISFFRMSADKDNSKARWLLNYVDSNMPENESDQVRWLEDAAEQGIMTAAICLGDYELESFGFSCDKAIEFYNKAAKLGNEKALHRLGDYDELQWVLSKQRATEIYRAACALGNANACQKLNNIVGATK